MNKTGWWLVPALALIAGCSSEKSEPEEAAPTFHEVMKGEVDTRADLVWGVGNAAIGDKGGIDPAKMTDADWVKLAEGATSLQQDAPVGRDEPDVRGAVPVAVAVDVGFRFGSARGEAVRCQNVEQLHGRL